MKVDGSYRFAAPVERVWAQLLDPAALAAAIPGCQKLEPLGNDEYLATLSIGIAAFKGTYAGIVSVTNKQPATAYDLNVEGSGRSGFVKGTGHITLVPDTTTTPTGTLVQVDGDAQVGGPVLTVGSRLVPPTARMLMNQFFENMQKQMEAPA